MFEVQRNHLLWSLSKADAARSTKGLVGRLQSNSCARWLAEAEVEEIVTLLAPQATSAMKPIKVPDKRLFAWPHHWTYVHSDQRFHDHQKVNDKAVQLMCRGCRGADNAIAEATASIILCICDI